MGNRGYVPLLTQASMHKNVCDYDNYLLDKIIPSILKMGPNKKASPTLVCGVHWSSGQAN